MKRAHIQRHSAMCAVLLVILDLPARGEIPITIIDAVPPRDAIATLQGTSLRGDTLSIWLRSSELKPQSVPGAAAEARALRLQGLA